MDIFINTDKSPAQLQGKATGSPLSSFRVKRGAVVPLSVTILGSDSASGLRMGIKAKGNYEGDLLILAEADSGEQTELGKRFDLKLVTTSVELNDILDVGEGSATPPATIAAMTEFAWQEDGETRLSDTLQTTIINDIIRLASEAPESTAGEYPAPDLVATKSWVNSKQATADAAGFVMLGTADTVSGKNVRPVGKTEDGGLAVDVSGLTAYEIAVDNGFIGTEEAWLASLKGERGAKGEQGEQGVPGETPSAEDVANAAIEILAEPISVAIEHSTCTGNDNASFLWAQINSTHLKAGLLSAITMPCRANTTGSICTTPVYLSIWQRMQPSDTEFTWIGTSTNTAAQSVGLSSRWEFDNLELNGDDIRICPVTDASVHWQETNMMGGRVIACTDTASIGCRIYSSTANSNHLVELNMELSEQHERFTPGIHADDATIHLTAEERTKWNTAADTCQHALIQAYTIYTFSNGGTRHDAASISQILQYLDIATSIAGSDNFMVNSLGNYALLVTGCDDFPLTKGCLDYYIDSVKELNDEGTLDHVYLKITYF